MRGSIKTSCDGLANKKVNEPRSVEVRVIEIEGFDGIKT